MSFNSLSGKLRIVVAALAAVTLAGCASVERTSPGIMDGLDVVGGDTPALQTICVRNSGVALFHAIVAECGDVRYNRAKHGMQGGIVFFDYQCDCHHCYKTMQDAANDEGKALTNVSMFNNSLPSGGITGWIQLLGFLFEFEDVGCSGVLRAKPKNVAQGTASETR